MIKIKNDTPIIARLISAIDSYIECQQIENGNKNNITNPFIYDEINGYPVFSPGQVSDINNCNDQIVIIDHLMESYNIHWFFDEYPTDKFYLFLANGFWNTNDLKIKYKVVTFNYILYSTVESHHSLSYSANFYQDKNYNFNYKKEYLFTSLIGKIKPWRDKFVDVILNGVNCNNYILNYNGKEFKQPAHHYDIKYDFDNFNSYENISPTKCINIGQMIPIEMFNRSKILLVVETSCFDFVEFHLTEKTVKALITGMPFVVVSSYKFLENLKALGFKTYSDIWSEDYDQIQDQQQRFESIVETLNYIDTLEWNDELIDKLKMISYHNKEVLMNLNVIAKKQIKNIVEIINDIDNTDYTQ